jgi:hypothetical protein
MVRQRLYTQISKKCQQAVTLRKTNAVDFEDKLENLEINRDVVGLKKTERIINCFDSPERMAGRRHPRVLAHWLDKLSVVNRPRRNTDL